MTLPELHIYPIITAIIFPFTFILTYVIAVLLEHTEFDWPYISDTGAYPPESCIFAQLLNLGAVLVGIVVYIRYKQVQEFFVSHQFGQKAIRLNRIGLFLGWSGAFGISIVANFQETAVFKVHLGGAILAFGVGSMYLWIQVYSSFKLSTLTHSVFVTYVRLILSIICSLGFVMMLVMGALARDQFTGKDPTKWYPGDPGWPLHVSSTVSEWFMALAFNLFLLTFVTEFKKVQLDSPQICLRIRESNLLISSRDENPCNEADVQSLQSSVET